MPVDPFLGVLLIVMAIVGLPCLLVRPLFIAIADRIAGKKSNARELDEMKHRVLALETEVRSLRVQVIGIESNQEYSNRLLETMKKESEDAPAGQE